MTFQYLISNFVPPKWFQQFGIGTNAIFDTTDNFDIRRSFVNYPIIAHYTNNTITSMKNCDKAKYKICLVPVTS